MPKTVTEIRRLTDEMKLSGIQLANYAEIEALSKAAGNTPQGQLATKYVFAVNAMKEEFVTLINNGYAPTDPAWQLANQQINSNFGVLQMNGVLDEAQKIVSYRYNAIPGLLNLGPGSANQYTGQQPLGPMQENPTPSATPSGGGEWTTLPDGTRIRQMQ